MYFETNQVNDILICDQCEGKLDIAKILPCGKTVCSFCAPLNLLSTIDNKFDCLVCKNKHEVPKDGLPDNLVALKMLSIKPTRISRGKFFDSLQRSLDEVQKKYYFIKNCIENRNDLVNDHCMNLRSDVQLKTEEAIQQINDISRIIIEEINEHEKRLIKLNNTNIMSLNKFTKIADELQSFHTINTEYLKQHTVDDDKIKKLDEEATYLVKKTQSEIQSLKDVIFDSKLLAFKTNKEKLNKSILGETKVWKTSGLFDFKQKNELMLLCEFPVDQKWDLIYKASKDGFQAVRFHSKCDDKANTLVVIKSKNGNIFGGYTEKSWSNTNFLSPYIDKSDSNAFIFSIINKENRSLKIKCSPNNGIRCNNNCGPIFGGKAGYSDILIGNLSNLSPVNHSYLGHYYTHSDYKYGSDKACSLLAGSCRFEVSDIEVYTTN
jgi:hypothetical protein